MEVAVAIAAVFGLVLLARNRSSTSSQNGQDVAKGLGSLAAAGVGALTSAVGGTAAAGATVAGSTAAAEATANSIADTAITLDTSGYAADNAAAAAAIADAAASTSVLGSAIAGGFMFLCCLAWVVLAEALEFLSAHADWWQYITDDKHQRYFLEWWRFEQSALVSYIGDPNIAPTGGVDANGHPYFPTTLDDGSVIGEAQHALSDPSAVDLSAVDPGVAWEASQFGDRFIGQVFDPRVPRQALVDLRIVARWSAITRSIAWNKAVKTFYDRNAQFAPFDSMTGGALVPPGSVQPGSFGPQGNVTPEFTSSGYQGVSFLPGNGAPGGGTVPSMSDAAMLELADNYCSLQPFARTGTIPASEDTRTLFGFPRPQSSQLAGHSVRGVAQQQPVAAGGQWADSMALPGFLSQYTSWKATAARASQLLGGDFGHQSNVARVMGHAQALGFLCGSVVYQNAIWPGDDQVVRELRDSCGLTAAYSVAHVNLGDLGICSCLVDKSSGYVVDVIAGRNLRGPAAYFSTSLFSVVQVVA